MLPPSSSSRTNCITFARIPPGFSSTQPPSQPMPSGHHTNETRLLVPIPLERFTHAFSAGVLGGFSSFALLSLSFSFSMARHLSALIFSATSAVANLWATICSRRWACSNFVATAVATMAIGATAATSLARRLVFVVLVPGGVSASDSFLSPLLLHLLPSRRRRPPRRRRRRPSRRPHRRPHRRLRRRRRRRRRHRFRPRRHRCPRRRGSAPAFSSGAPLAPAKVSLRLEFPGDQQLPGRLLLHGASRRSHQHQQQRQVQ
mmetsp:Transcript_57279/g.114931  ORF Transcript_57279/g.114931 Transcript_57279/m.114931 type:complete len:260 (-) Transcript_57279:1370-2149(-)